MNGNAGEYKRSMSVLSNDVSIATQITCTFPQTISAIYMNTITHILPNPEINPMIFTFSKIKEPELAQLSYIDSTRSISTVPIVKLRDDNEKFIFIEGGGEDYLTVHTIYKKTGIATYAKNINLAGIIPSTTSAMGSCVGY
jgi:hypothetical protein